MKDTQSNCSPDSAASPLVVPPAQAAAMLQVHENTIYRLVKAGELEAVKIGVAQRITTESIRRVASQGARTRKAAA